MEAASAAQQQGFASCLGSPPNTILEDAKVGACLYRTLGVDCIDTNRGTFGNLDVFDNRHKQERHIEAMATLPTKTLVLAGSFHSVQSNITYRLHRWEYAVVIVFLLHREGF